MTEWGNWPASGYLVTVAMTFHGSLLRSMLSWSHATLLFNKSPDLGTYLCLTYVCL